MARDNPKLEAALLGTVLMLGGCGTHVVVGERTDHDASTVEAGGKVKPPLDGGAISCGATACAPVDVGGGLGTLLPCCFGEDKCGALLSSACIELHAQGPADPGCPSLPPYEGCCRPDGMCGVIVAGTAFGCVAFPFIPAPTLARCTPADH